MPMHAKYTCCDLGKPSQTTSLSVVESFLLVEKSTLTKKEKPTDFKVDVGWSFIDFLKMTQ